MQVLSANRFLTNPTAWAVITYSAVILALSGASHQGEDAMRVTLSHSRHRRFPRIRASAAPSQCRVYFTPYGSELGRFSSTPWSN